MRRRPWIGLTLLMSRRLPARLPPIARCRLPASLQSRRAMRGQLSLGRMCLMRPRLRPLHRLCLRRTLRSSRVRLSSRSSPRRRRSRRLRALILAGTCLHRWGRMLQLLTLLLPVTRPRFLSRPGHPRRRPTATLGTTRCPLPTAGAPASRRRVLPSRLHPPAVLAAACPGGSSRLSPQLWW